MTKQSADYIIIKQAPDNCGTLTYLGTKERGWLTTKEARTSSWQVARFTKEDADRHVAQCNNPAITALHRPTK